MKDDVLTKGSFEGTDHFETLRLTRSNVAMRVVNSSDAAVLPAPSGPAHQTSRRDNLYRRYGKRLLDVAFVLATAPLTLSITLLCALALWIEGGQPFYRQPRLGANGKTFRIFKLRTMGRNAEQDLKNLLEKDAALRKEWVTTQKLKNDPRITPVGALLRCTSLDEMPQFLNVLKGEMSIVGPRPMMPDQLRLYPDPSSYFGLRPGITGEWQVSDRNENSFANRSNIDTRYDFSMTLIGDLKIIAKTIGVIMRRTGY